MLDSYNEPPDTPEYIHFRLGPARVLESSGIPFVVYSEDALAFVHFVPTTLFDFTILVPDELVQAAVDHLQKELPTFYLSQLKEYRLTDDDGVCVLPRAVRLEQPIDPTEKALPMPDAILIVPQSYFHFDVRDLSRSRGLIHPCDPSDLRIRFPTMPAFFDSLIDTAFEPIDGIEHLNFRGAYLFVFLSYLVLYNLRVRDDDRCTFPDTDELLPSAKALLEGVKPENTAFLDA